ncbi:sensor histidine kinase [Vibrio parahaemolyticus]
MTKWYQGLRLIHQIGLVILLGFGLSFLLSIYLLSSEKSENLSFLSSSGAIQRVISVTEILAQTPAELHSSIIHASQSTDLSLSISRQPQVHEPARHSSEELQLIRKLNQAGIEQVHLALVKRERPILNMSDMHDAMMTGMSMREMHSSRMSYVATIDGSVKLGTDTWLNFSSGIQQDTTHWSTGILLSLVGVMITTVGGCILIINKALTPIRNLEVSARQFAQNRLVSPIESHGPADLLPTITAFNEMQTQLADYIQERSKLLAAISHDLRTPLTSLRLRLEFIEESDDKQQMLQTLSIMDKMLTSTMRFAKDDSQLEPRQRTNINSLLQTVVDEYSDRNVRIDYQDSKELIESIPPLSIRRMIENLVNNSVQYGGAKNTIAIKVKKQGQFLHFEVSDTGVGIEDDKLQEVVKPFTRLDSARDTGSSNVGLGLSITSTLASAYGGKLTLQRNSPSGLICTFTIALSQ